MDFVFDLIEPHNIKNTRAGLEIRQGVLVKNIELDEGLSDRRVFMKVLKDAGCPKIDDPFSDEEPDVIVEEHDLVSVGRSERHCRMMVVYRGPAVMPEDEGGAPFQYLLSVDYQTTRIQTAMTAGGVKPITIWYDHDLPPVDYDEEFPPKGIDKVAKASKFRSYKVLTATGYATLTQWNGIKESVKGVADSINADEWGSSPRGTWYFPGPQVTRVRGNPMLRIQLPFLEAKDGHFPVIMWHNREGKIPFNVTAEKTLREQAPAGPPAEGELKKSKGICIPSVQDEGDFSPVFSFTPDDVI